jgi:hypothetical protein
MSSPHFSGPVLAAAAMLSLALPGCIGPDFPTAEQSLCTVAGIGCRPECLPALIPPSAANALTYDLGPASCAPADWAEAARQADKLCAARGLAAIGAGPIIEEPPVAPLPPAETATFLCERRG